MHRVFLRAPIIEKPFLRSRRDLSTSLSFPPSGCTNSHYTAPRAAEFIMQKAFSVYITRKHKARALCLSTKINIPNEPHAACTENFLIKKAAGAVWWEREKKSGERVIRSVAQCSF